jgi:multidrug efflux pump subunit AcrA (membrane-fusion protein)
LRSSQFGITSAAVSFRDDHDAALARAEALEAELERERAKVAEREKQLEIERAERQRLEQLVGVQMPKVRAPGERVHSSEPSESPFARQPPDMVGFWLTVSVIAAFGLCILGLVVH